MQYSLRLVDGTFQIAPRPRSHDGVVPIDGGPNSIVLHGDVSLLRFGDDGLHAIQASTKGCTMGRLMLLMCASGDGYQEPGFFLGINIDQGGEKMDKKWRCPVLSSS